MTCFRMKPTDENSNAGIMANPIGGDANSVEVILRLGLEPATFTVKMEGKCDQ